MQIDQLEAERAQNTPETMLIQTLLKVKTKNKQEFNNADKFAKRMAKYQNTDLKHTRTIAGEFIIGNANRVD